MGEGVYLLVSYFQEAELYHVCCCPGGCPVLPKSSVGGTTEFDKKGNPHGLKSSESGGRKSVHMSTQHFNESQGNVTGEAWGQNICRLSLEFP